MKKLIIFLSRFRRLCSLLPFVEVYPYDACKDELTNDKNINDKIIIFKTLN